MRNAARIVHMSTENPCEVPCFIIAKNIISLLVLQMTVNWGYYKQSSTITPINLYSYKWKNKKPVVQIMGQDLNIMANKKYSNYSNTLIGKFLLLFAISFIVGSCSTQRIVDSTSNKRPDWVYGIQRGYITGYGIDTSIEAAQNKAIIDIRAKITEAIVSEIQSRKQLSTSEMTNNNTYHIVSTFLKETISTSDRGIITRGVSISNASDYYYEVTRDRQSGETYARYYIQYPFSFSEMNQLMAEWENRQNRLIAQKDEIAARISNHQTVEELVDDIYRIIQIGELLVYDSGASIEMIMAGLYSSLNGIQPEITEEKDGLVKFLLKTNGKEIRTNMRPWVEARNALVKSVYQEHNGWTIEFGDSHNNLKSDNLPQLHIQISYRNWKLKYTHNIDPHVEIEFLSPIFFQVKQFSFWNTHVNVFDCILQTSVSGLGGVTLEKIILKPQRIVGWELEDLPALSIELGQGIHVRSGESMHNIEVRHRLHKNTWSQNSNYPIRVKGTIFYRETYTGARKSKTFSGGEIKTNW